ncbi:MAG: methyltransferase domain-containing protein [Alphaproteobacteria bacterium]|nr:methyltransferase domain-containing protein [Alphaproteobacteria bacterium]
MKLDDVQRNYDRLSRSYDFWNRWLIEPFVGIEGLRQRTVDALELPQGGSVLDIACGTGLNLPYLARQVGPEGQLVGLDYSPGMLAQAGRRAQAAGWENVRLVQGDAAVLAGVGGPFDGVMSTWALGIVDDLPAALRRAVEVLRPGGRLAILDLDRSRAERGLRRLFDPILHLGLRLSGVDSAEDLDDERLAQRWQDGQAFLHQALEDVRVERNTWGSGFLLLGRRPERDDE